MENQNKNDNMNTTSKTSKQSISNSPESGDICGEKSQLKERVKGLSKKNNTENVPQRKKAVYLPTENLTSKEIKLFPIFAPKIASLSDKTGESRSVKRKRKTSIKKIDSSENIDKSSNEQSKPKVKKKSIAEYFQKIANTQDDKVSKSIPKLFPIFSSHTKPNSNSPTEPKKMELKKINIDDQMAILTNDEKKSLMMESENISERNPLQVSTPIKKKHVISQKGRNNTFAAAVLRSCNSKSICYKNSNDALENTSDSETSVDDLETVLEKKSRKKIKTKVLEILPQSQDSFKSSIPVTAIKDSEKIVRKTGRPSSVDLKQVQEISIIEESRKFCIPDTAFEDSEKIVRKARRLNKPCPTFSDIKSYSKVKEIQEGLSVENNEVILVSDNVNNVSENIQRKFGRPSWKNQRGMVSNSIIFSDKDDTVSQLTTINSNINFTIKEEETFDNIPVPLWNDIIGLTNVKTIESVTSINKVDLTAHSLISSSDNDLWTLIPNDSNLKEGVSESTISELGSWLKNWKSKFSKSTRHKQDKDESFDSLSCDSSDSDGEELSNSVILMGPPGCGKTSLVFSLASEHGFKVLEVNASSCRSGRIIRHQLKEALESYHVDNTKTTGVKLVHEKEGYESMAKLRAKDITSKKPAIKKINSFFQKEKSQPVIVKDEKKMESIKSSFQPKSSTTKPKSQNKSKLDDETSENNEVPKDSNLCSISSQTIILFDDVDVVFQEDEEFWSTIRGFLKISKKPVIFTVSRNLEIVKANLDVDIQVLHLKPMINEISIQKLQEQFKKHNRNSNLNLKLLAANSNDVRRNLLHAQFWSQLASNQKIKVDEKPLNSNTFNLGSSTADFNSFIFDQSSSYTHNLISNYNEIGYDILYANLFAILNVNHDQEPERKWKIVTTRSEELNKSDTDPNPDTINDIPQKNLLQEDCQIFEFKKSALKNDCSKDLYLFSNILEDFSFVDTIKGHYCKNTNWISQNERLRKWSIGLPMCNDYKLSTPTDFALDASSRIQVLTLQEAYKLKKLDTQECMNKTMSLDHPFLNRNKMEERIQIIKSVTPANFSVRKTVLNIDYLSVLKNMCESECSRLSKTGRRRKLHYFDSISLFLDRHQIDQILQW